MKKLTFDKQIIIGLAVLLIAYIGSWIFKQGIFVNAAWVLYGLAFIIHPVYPEKSKRRKKHSALGSSCRCIMCSGRNYYPVWCIRRFHPDGSKPPRFLLPFDYH